MDNQNQTNLAGSLAEQRWLKERMDTLSVRERRALTAVMAKHQPERTDDMINCLMIMDKCKVCFPVENLEQLGQFSLRESGGLPENILPYVNFVRMGELYRDRYPGVFIGDSYVICPDDGTPLYDGQTLPEDMDWSVKLKLASPAVPEGVWVRLPDDPAAEDHLSQSTEVSLALKDLDAESLDDCTLLEAHCILPQISDLTEQYDNIAELVRDGSCLGHIMNKLVSNKPRWMERFAAALEYENCHDLRPALDISQNMGRYEWMPCEQLEEFGKMGLRSRGVPESLIKSGCIDAESFAIDLLEASGHMQASGETGFILRNKLFDTWIVLPSMEEYTSQEAGLVLG